MNLNRVKGLLIQEFFITLRSFEVILDIMVFPVMSIIMFGFLASYLTASTSREIAFALIAGMLLWQVVFIVQYSVAVGSLWNIWSRNLSNMFITPLTVLDYLFAQSLSGIIKAFFVFIPSALLAILIFKFNIFDLGLFNLLIYIANLILFAISLGVVILGLIFRFGTRIQAFAWGLIPIIQPLSAAFYPVSVLPSALQPIAYALPPTYIFEALRLSIVHPQVVQWQHISVAFGINIIYFILALAFFKFMFTKSKIVGQFARLEG